MASFGAASTSDVYAAEALRAVDAIVEELDRWRKERLTAGLAAPGIGLAVASGNVLFGAVGDETRLEYTVIGDAVNLAAKLEKHAKTEQVVALTDRITFELALTQGYVPTQRFEYRNRRYIDGIGEPVDLVVLAIHGAGDAAERDDAQRSQFVPDRRNPASSSSITNP
jgi:adenylate cyclase